MPGKIFNELVEIMATLRGPDGCPWDREQTHESLKPYLLEEAYEVLEVIGHPNPAELQEELGDLLLQTLFHAQVADENGHFSIEDVLQTLKEKLVRRHPHVFGDIEIKTAEQQKNHWESLKKKEGKKSVIDGVPKAMPSLLRAHRLQQKAATVGFDWPRIEPVWDKVHEEMDELKEAVDLNDPAKMHEEFGDLLFALVNLSRFLKINPEESLRGATEKFIYRFQQVESRSKSQGRDLSGMTLEEMDTIWNLIKKESQKSDSPTTS